MRQPLAGPLPFQEGLALLEEQRLALLGDDSVRLSHANIRLSGWIGALRDACARTPYADAADEPTLRQLRDLLDANALLARRFHARTARALESMMPSARGTYDAQGLASGAVARRTTRSA